MIDLTTFSDAPLVPVRGKEGLFVRPLTLDEMSAVQSEDTVGRRNAHAICLALCDADGKRLLCQADMASVCGWAWQHAEPILAAINGGSVSVEDAKKG